MKIQIISKRTFEVKDKVTYTLEVDLIAETKSGQNVNVTKEEFDKYTVGQVLEL